MNGKSIIKTLLFLNVRFVAPMLFLVSIAVVFVSGGFQKIIPLVIYMVISIVLAIIAGRQ